MGIVILAALGAGLIIGLLVATPLCGLAIFLLTRLITQRTRVVPLFSGLFVLFAAALYLAIQLFAFGPSRPGAEYNAAISHYFWGGLLYVGGLGVAASLATAAAWLIPTPLRPPPLPKVVALRPSLAPPPLPRGTNTF